MTTTETQLRSLTLTKLLAVSLSVHRDLLDLFVDGDEHNISVALSYLANVHREIAKAYRLLSENGLLTGDGWRALGHELGANGTPNNGPRTTDN